MSQDSVERWERVAALVDAALEREPVERAAYLDEACAGERALHAEVEALLAGAGAPSFLDSAAIIFAAPLLDASESGRETASPTGSPKEATELLRALAREHQAHAARSSAVPNGVLTERGLPYALERKLGRGGMATVYLARDAKHDRRVAVKVLNAELTACVGAQRFVQEIRLTARLQHPHVLGLLDSGVFGAEAGVLAGRPYYVMPYLEGESLRARLARGDSLASREAVRVLREVADALCYAHEQGVVHRDIKPENILLSREHAVVADFGIAKALLASQTDEAGSGTASGTMSGTLTQLGVLVGTPAYMAPEQAAGWSEVDHRADLYAWGVLAYELLAGHHPFEGRTSPDELVAAHAGETPRVLAEVAPAVPFALAALVMRCLAKAPADRPSSGAEILATLDVAVVTAAPPVASGLVSSRRGHRRMVAVLGVLLILGGVRSAYQRRVQGDQHGSIAADGPVAPPLATATSAAAHAILVVGAGDPTIDVPAVQAAVDQGGDVILKGHFSFRGPPTKPLAPLLASGWYPPAAEVLVSKAVTVSGVRDAHDQMATIEAGTIPFYVDAPGQRVAIRGLRFVRPTSDAILVHAVRGVQIESNTIEGLVPFAGGAEGIGISTSGAIPMPVNQGDPENVSGQLLIRNNNVDAVGGTTRESTAGVLVFGVGSPNHEADLIIAGNDIGNTTGATINIRQVNGRVRVLGNRLRTGHEKAIRSGEAVRLVNTGSYLMADNTIECRWANGAGIAVFSQFAEWPIERAVVEDNDVLMSPPPGTAFGDSSAGINIRGFARGNVVRHNRIRGRARAALAVYGFRGGVPAENAFIDNRLEDFHAALAAMFVGSGVVRTRIVRPGVVMDHGVGTIIER